MARHRFILILGILFLAAAGAHPALDRLSRPPAPPSRPQRIVSLSPGITETLYALGLGPFVVGVTSFCGYPPEAALLPKVAGFSEVNFEGVLRVRPDLVALPEDHMRDKQFLQRMGLPVLTLDTLSLSGLLRTITVLGRSTGRAEAANALTAKLAKAMADAKAVAEGRPKPRALLAVMRADQGSGGIAEIHVVGKDGFYNELIAAAGGRNAYAGDLAFPRLSREAMLFLDPEVIVEVLPPGVDPEAAKRDWQSLSSVSAVKTGRIFLLTDQAHTVPGPRFVLTLALLSKAFHPETAPARL